tara:strand:- start:158 stop:679 length:522 start_codon:yes stop_codon:yes gene_type:complete
MKKKKLISYSETFDANTGEIITSIEREIKLPDKVRFSGQFTKIGDRARLDINNKDLWKFIILSDFLEYETNRLVYRNVGRKPILLRQHHMADILEVTVRTVNTLIKNLIKSLAIFKFKTGYYINPTFASRSQYISTKYLIKMIELDPSITSMIDEKQQYLIRKYLKVEIKADI